MSYKPSPMRKQEFVALETLLRYDSDEYFHWLDSGKPDEGHIYNFISVLEDYVQRCNSETKANETTDNGQAV